VADHVYRIPLPLPNDALHAVNVYAIDHGRSVTMIDGGWDVGTTTDVFARALAELGYRFADIERVLVTHVHRDHYSYALALRRAWGVQVSLGAQESATLAAIGDLAAGRACSAQPARLRRAGAATLADTIEHNQLSRKFADYSELPDHWIDDDESIELAGRTLRSIPTPGHTRGHVVFRDDDAGLLFTGDHLLPHITPSIGFEAAPSVSPLADYLESLARVKQLDDSPMLPAHGPVGPSVHARADELLAHHARRLHESAAAIAAGAGTAYEVALRLRWTRRGRQLEELDPYNQMLAVLETNAHLVVLVAQGRLHSDDVDGITRYCEQEPA
jgi:glyoxylase-like metal-dependent hydrolase (beta-lactamase superfamily II)